ASPGARARRHRRRPPRIRRARLRGAAGRSRRPGARDQGRADALRAQPGHPGAPRGHCRALRADIRRDDLARPDPRHRRDVAAGTCRAMSTLFGHLLNPGDEVVLRHPYYACYPNFIKYAEGRPVYVGVPEEDGFQYRPEAIRERITARTRAIMINSPANPTGTVLSADRMATIGALSRDNGPVIVSDEIYHGLSYEGRDRTILEFTDRAFVLNGFSKAYAMPGWRLGWVIAPRDHIRALQTLYGNFFISTNEFVQWAGVAALREAGDDSRRFRAIFDDRRRAMLAGLKSLGFGVGAEPTGAFYVLANARPLSTDSVSLAREILESCHVAVTPGAAFGANAEGYLRFSYASSLERIEEGLERLRRFLGGSRRLA